MAADALLQNRPHRQPANLCAGTSRQFCHSFANTATLYTNRATFFYIDRSNYKILCMRPVCFALFSFAILAFSCEKAQVEESAWLNAVVIDTNDINCGFPLLDFSEDSTKVRAITGEAYRLQFISTGLPMELSIEGNRIRVIITKLKPEESFPCLTLGPNYPAIKIANASAR